MGWPKTILKKNCNMLRIGITGHRDILNTDEVRSEIATCLQDYKKIDKELLAITSVAAGADTIFTEEAIKQNIPLQIELPFALEEYKKDFNQADLEKLEDLIKGTNYNVVSAFLPNDSEARKNGYLAAGQKMVDLADVVIAVWDRKPARGKGGTADIVKYAKSQNKTVMIIKAVRIAK